MKESLIKINNLDYRVFELSAAVVGSGAAGYASALRLYEKGVTDIAVISEDLNFGTSRNTGSDKQTYYKLSLCGSEPDSPFDMAKDLFAGGSVDGDIALVEAVNSVNCFMKLNEIGVEFPVNRFGEFVGYKTDHDKRARATSVGPLTSKIMTEKLEAELKKNSVIFLDKLLVVKIIVENERVCGLICLDKNTLNGKESNFVFIKCSNIIFATGGPSGVYKDNVYPLCHTGSSGTLFECGVTAQNLTEWQYGLASINPRWNVSGTYMQVLPRFVSKDENGNSFYFLEEKLSKQECLSLTFLKGYEWPFDIRKVKNRSSIIDLLVYEECFVKNRKVYLDYTQNPYGEVEADYDSLLSDGREYLKKANALNKKPIDRLLIMNKPAYDLYLSKGVDLKVEPLEISLSAQHCNGGAKVDYWWQTNIKGLFAVGEVAGTHGVYRPGGSALNSGQVGALRAATFIASKPQEPCENFEMAIENVFIEILNIANKHFSKESNVNALIEKTKTEMTVNAAAIRNKDGIKKLLDETKELLNLKTVEIKTKNELISLFKYRDICLVREYILFSMLDFYEKTGGKSRGSALYKLDNAEIDFDFCLAGDECLNLIQEVGKKNNKLYSAWRKVKPLECEETFFENVWKEFRENKNII